MDSLGLQKIIVFVYFWILIILNWASTSQTVDRQEKDLFNEWNQTSTAVWSLRPRHKKK